MDNLSHSLAGLVTAELVVQVRCAAARQKAIDRRWHRAAWLVSIGAHNAPDLDIAYAWIFAGKLGYLLHHRGHTHTFALAPVISALPIGCVWLWARRRGVALSRADWLWLSLLALLGPIGHILLDFANHYGVHPFWPFSNRWIAGDAIFIVEPLLWACTVPLAIAATEAPVGRSAWTVVLGLAIALPWLGTFGRFPAPIPWPFALACTLLAVLTLGVTLRLSALARAALPWVLCGAVVTVFVGSGVRAERAIRDALMALEPDSPIVDLARVPMPTTPACWQAVAIRRRTDGYELAIVHASAWSTLVDVETCARMAPRAHTAPLVPGPIRGPVRISATFRAPLAVLREAALRCDAQAFLRFARAPFFVRERDRWIAGDLRYDRERGLGFAEIALPLRPERVRCPVLVAPWEPWRARDLIAPAPLERALDAW
jgi:inner membrane protein